jgi:nucleoside-diphosphate-sugar epimerase
VTSRDKTLFLTGANGFVGAAINRNASGFLVTPLARNCDAARLFRDAPAGSVLIHAAWPSPPSAGIQASHADANNQAWSTFRRWSADLRRAAIENGVWFIGVGSGVERYADDPRLAEPYLTYAKQKRALRDELAAPDPSTFSWLRLHFLFGPYENPKRIIPSAIAACRAGETLACGSLERQRRWLHVDDCADMIARFAASPETGDWDIAGREEISFRQLLDMVSKACGRPLAISPDSPIAADAALTKISPTTMAPIVPRDAGRTDNLLARMTEYVHWLDNRRTAGIEEG